MTKKYVYSFKEGNKEMKEELGGKGANLSEMTSIGIPVPPGFTISTDACAEYYENDKKYPDNLQKQVNDKLEELEKEMDAKLGDNENPLLVSVRSGAAVSMPGMMDTVLNLGLNDSSVQGLIKKTGNERFAWDSYRRFINMFGNVVMNVEHKHFEEVIEKAKATKGVEVDTDLDAEDLKNVCEGYKEVVQKHAGKMFPEDPKEQLKMSVDAVFNSWNSKRAIIYRKINNIAGLNGTAVNVQTMVFGNMGDTSGTGVCFTRDPSTGENKFYGEFLMNAQGEDVVAGIRTPQPIIELKKIMEENYEELVNIREKLEKHYKDMQDIEFTIQDKKLYILQTRSGKRTAQAAIKMVVDMVEEKLIDKETGLLRVDPEQLNHLLHKQLDPIGKEKAEVIAKGLPASPGAAVGVAAFTAEEAARFAEEGEKVILVRNETSPEDIEGMDASQGILTAKGGMTSHAAVVARGMGKCCVAGCADIIVNEETKEFSVDGTVIKEKDWITLDGSAGDVMLGQVPVTDPELSGDFGILMEWADEVRKLGIRTNADTPKDSQVALKFGAEGIGLCRTEHMFFEGERIKAVREMILSENLAGRKKALEKLLPFQKADFKGLFEVMEGKPVKIRTLDPPLHEFLPKEEADIKEIAKELGVSLEKLKEKIESLHEFNPMLGHRGCRLGITYPEITEMQARAIIEAACEVVSEKNIKVYPEIMIPLVGNVKELEDQKKLVDKVAKKVMKEEGVEVDYEVGTMIEIPRAALTAHEVASEADFFSFGTNDLTQMACGFSRDDSGTFLGEYVDRGIYPRDPFQAIDQTGVGELMKICVEKARKVKPKMHIGICGEHGGEPSSVEFCHRIGLDYVSCSPFRVPIARLAAAQAALRK